jgi:hypothetical protein
MERNLGRSTRPHHMKERVWQTHGVASHDAIRPLIDIDAVRMNKCDRVADERSRPPIALSGFNGATAKSTTIDQQIGRVCYSIRADNLDDNLIPVDSDHLDVLERGEARLVTRSNKGQRARLNFCSRHLE